MKSPRSDRNEHRPSVTRNVVVAAWGIAGVFLAAPALGQAPIRPAHPPVEEASHATEAFGLADAVVPNEPKPALLPPSEAFGLALRAVAGVTLDAVDAEALRLEDGARAIEDKIVRYGVARDVGIDPAAGDGYDIVGVGTLWVMDLTATGALGVRVHFADVNMPVGAQLFVYSPSQPDRLWGPYEGRGIMDSGEIWTPTVFGERVRIEYLVPESAPIVAKDWEAIAVPDEEAPAFVIDRIQHVYRDPVAEDPGRVGSCHNDVTCYSAWANTAKAAAGIGTINSDALYCSGTMLAASNNDLTPYWLTANHCISSGATATNAEIYWLYQTSSCGGSPPSLSSVPQSAVCTRLSYSSTSDYSLLMVEGTVPSGLYWAGWSSSAVANGTNVTCVHHPDGSFKRISFATKTSGAAANFIRADWYDAPTEPGSSGSGLFLDSTKQLVGQLYGGPSSCSNESYDDYGAFASTYPNVSSLLAGGSDDSLEPNDSCAAARTMAGGTSAGLVVKKYTGGDEDWYKFTLNTGAQVTASFSFTHAYGDIDVQLYNACGGSVVASSTGSGNSESFSYANSGASATFYLRVYLYNDTRNSYSMTLTVPGGGGGSNDTCANATTVVNGGTYTGSTSSATRDGSASCGSSSTTRDVWYKYTAPASGTLSLDTCGSSYDTVVSIHSTCPGTTSNQLNCNDDCGGSPCGAVSSCLTRSVTSGTTYIIRMSGYNGASGSFVLHVTGP